MYASTSVLTIAALLFSPSTLAAAVYPSLTPQQAITSPSISNVEVHTNNPKVPGPTEMHHCSDPSHDLFQIRRLGFWPGNPRVGYYVTVRFVGRFISGTGDTPWLNVTGVINGRKELGPMYYAPLCDIDVWQTVHVQRPDGNDERDSHSHRSCPPAIQEGYAVISSPPIPMYPSVAPEGIWEVRAEATTQDGRRIFCVEGSFNVTK